MLGYSVIRKRLICLISIWPKESTFKAAKPWVSSPGTRVKFRRILIILIIGRRRRHGLILTEISVSLPGYLNWAPWVIVKVLKVRSRDRYGQVLMKISWLSPVYFRLLPGFDIHMLIVQTGDRSMLAWVTIFCITPGGIAFVYWYLDSLGWNVNWWNLLTYLKLQCSSTSMLCYAYLVVYIDKKGFGQRSPTIPLVSLKWIEWVRCRTYVLPRTPFPHPPPPPPSPTKVVFVIWVLNLSRIFSVGFRDILDSRTSLRIKCLLWNCWFWISWWYLRTDNPYSAIRKTGLSFFPYYK